MVTKKPIPPDEFAQRSLDEPDSGDARAKLRDLAEHSDTLVKIAESHVRWQWLRTLLKSLITWAGIALALLAALRDEVVALFRGGP